MHIPPPMTLVNEFQKDFWFWVLKDLSPDLCFYQILYSKTLFLKHSSALEFLDTFPNFGCIIKSIFLKQT